MIDQVLATSHGEAAYKVVEKLIDAGHEAWWVGGAVRMMLTECIPHEIDMATSAKPDEIIKIFPKNDSSSAVLGTVIVSLSGQHFEITTFREDDAASDGRHPERVHFGSLEQDALRRDATINAMYWNPISRELFDPCHGEADLAEALVRFIGDPAKRIQHDALRILRMIRLRTAIHGQYHPETYKALQKHSALVSGLSGMRVLQELEKLLQTQKPSIGLEDWFELGILHVLFPALHACKGVAQPKEYHQEGDVWNHLKACADSYTDDFGPDVRIAGLFHDVGKAQTFSLDDRIRFNRHAEVSADIARSVLQDLQMSSERSKKIAWLISHHMMMGSFEDLSVERKAHWYFHPWFQELLQLFWIDIAGTQPSDFSLYDNIIQDYNVFLNTHIRPQKPLLSGNAVMRILGTRPGPKVGEALQRLEDAQLQKKISSKKEAEKFLREESTR